MSRPRTRLREVIDSNHRKLNRNSRFAPPKTNTLKHLQNEYRKTIPRPRYAFVTLVMCGDEYGKGALTLAWSLRQHKTQHELIVMVTPDVSVAAIKLLRKLYDRVIKVQYIKTRVKSALRGKKYRREDTWMEYSLTKARMLKLTEYDKLVWLDADSLVLNNIDNLFELPTPAGVCSSIRNHDYWHGSKIPELEIENAVENNYGVHGCTMVLTPNLDHYLLASSLPQIGTTANFVGPDEYFFTQLYKTEWHHIHVKYGCTKWFYEMRGVKAEVIHFFGDNPWEDESDWEGVRKWRDAAEGMVRVCPKMSDLFADTRSRSSSQRSRDEVKSLETNAKVSFRIMYPAVSKKHSLSINK
ncbi:hypothetical protein OS493_011553 [Desmophyllum pertusum]|uniref:glycogenin glucosyltransferase n=1 Tax=Desmophyllum pertusum TaxID=174260 RepID=A0A9W9YQR8_9CNID|nr:hypothetical protein OS493_011553 [Desmophyllum pertusum]